MKTEVIIEIGSSKFLAPTAAAAAKVADLLASFKPVARNYAPTDKPLCAEYFGKDWEHKIEIASPRGEILKDITAFNAWCDEVVSKQAAEVAK